MKQTISIISLTFFFANVVAGASSGDILRLFDIRYVGMLSPQYIAIHQGNDLPAGFSAQGLIDRVKKAGYNGIIAAVPTIIWDWGPTPARWSFYCDAKTPARDEYKMIQEAFETCRSNDLLFIPQICMSNRHSGPVWDFSGGIEFSSHVAKEFDATDDRLGTITARGDKAPGKAASKAFDNDPGSKWLDSSKTSWIRYDLEKGARRTIASYSITSAGDAPERDPADWQLSGSNDGSNWIVLDAQRGHIFSARKQKRTFSVSKPAAYAMYKLAVSKLRDSLRATATQCAEIELIAQTRYTATPLGPDRPGVPGMDHYFSRLLKRMQLEFTRSSRYKPGDYVPYIHLSHDEMHTWEDNYLLVNSPRDSAWIAAHGNNAMAFKRLMANELFRRTDDIGTILGAKTNVILYADMFDPELNGGLTLNTFLKDTRGNPVTLTLAPLTPAPGDTSLADLPGLTPAQKNTLKNRLILNPWWFRVYNHAYNPPREYDNKATIEYLTKSSRAFKILFFNAFDDPLYDNNEIYAEGCQQIKKQAALAPAYRNHILGYCASVYPCWTYKTCPGTECPCGTVPYIEFVSYWDHTKGMYDQPRAYDIIEVVRDAHAGEGKPGPGTGK